MQHGHGHLHAIYRIVVYPKRNRDEEIYIIRIYFFSLAFLLFSIDFIAISISIEIEITTIWKSEEKKQNKKMKIIISK